MAGPGCVGWARTMSRSTKLASAAAILAHVAAQGSGQLTTDAIAEAVSDHPARVRQLVRRGC